MINIIPGIIIALLFVILLRNSQLDFKKQNAAGRDEKQGQSVKEYLSGLKGLVQNRSLLLISTSSAFRSMTQNALLTFLPLYLAHELEFSPLWVGTGIFLLQMGGGARIFSLCGPSRDAGLADGIVSPKNGRHQHWPPVRDAVTGPIGIPIAWGCDF